VGGNLSGGAGGRTFRDRGRKGGNAKLTHRGGAMQERKVKRMKPCPLTWRGELQGGNEPGFRWDARSFLSQAKTKLSGVGR